MPGRSGADESSNTKFRDECLSLEWVRSRREAAVIIEAWRRHHMTPYECKHHHPVHPNRAVPQEFAPAAAPRGWDAPPLIKFLGTADAGTVPSFPLAGAPRRIPGARCVR